MPLDIDNEQAALERMTAGQLAERFAALFGEQTHSRHRTYLNRCVISIRKSTDAGLEQEFNSLDAQREVARAYLTSQANAQYDAEIAEMMDERVRLERDLARHHAEIRRVAVAGNSDAATTILIADLHERIAQATTRNEELDELIDDLHKARLNTDDLRAAFADFDRLWDTLTPREQAKIIALVVARIEFDPTASTISVTFHPMAIRTLMQTKLGGAA